MYYSPLTDQEWRYPDWKSVMEGKEKEVNELGINFDVVEHFLESV